MPFITIRGAGNMGKRDDNDKLDEIVEITPEAARLIGQIIDAGKATSPGGVKYTRREITQILKNATGLVYELVKSLF